VSDLVRKGEKKILLNLGDTSYIDSSGIGELVAAFTSVRKQGGELKLLNLTKKVSRRVADYQAYTVFHILDDGAAAIAAFSGSESSSLQRMLPDAESAAILHRLCSVVVRPCPARLLLPCPDRIDRKCPKISLCASRLL
jgi:hypothetical protein